MNNDKDNLIHVRTAARRYGLPLKWLKEQAISGNIPAVVADNQVLFDADVLLTWLAERARKGAEHDR